MSKPTDLVQGTLDMLILKTIALEPMQGWRNPALAITSSNRSALLLGSSSITCAPLAKLPRLDCGGALRPCSDGRFSITLAANGTETSMV